jgi:hypothetical protein
MARIASVLAATAAAVVLPSAASAQAHDHAAAASHGHESPVVSCIDLAAPPWNGLGAADRDQIASVQRSLAALSTPDAARAAGFTPALGDIPGMGVHYVSPERSRDGVNIDEPDHLLFATVDGKEQLVGAAYAFRDVPDTQEPIPYQSDLAHWHDHPQFAAQGQTLHMLHIWFVPSSNGPFAGLNFWLPFRAAGIQPPSSCWMADANDASRIQLVSFALGPRQWGDGGANVVDDSARQAARRDMLSAMDAAARAGDHDAWFASADRFIADLTPAERALAQATLGALSMAQMSSTEREEAHH